MVSKHSHSMNIRHGTTALIISGHLMTSSRTTALGLLRTQLRNKRKRTYHLKGIKRHNSTVLFGRIRSCTVNHIRLIHGHAYICQAVIAINRSCPFSGGPLRQPRSAIPATIPYSFSSLPCPLPHACHHKVTTICPSNTALS